MLYTLALIADSVNTPPKFGLNFTIWKLKMTIFLQFLGSRVVKTVTKPFIIPEDDEDIWSNIIVKKFDANAKAHHALLQALNDDDISRVIMMWNSEVCVNQKSVIE